MPPARDLVSVHNAASLPAATTLPRYDRAGLGCGIAHMSLGNFHRAHQALFVHEYLQAHPEEPWMIHGIGLLGPDRDLVERMRRQDCLYTLTERSALHDIIKVIGSIREVSHAPSDPPGVIDLLASDHIKIVSLTLTEAGYYYTAAGRLDVRNPVVEADLRPASIPATGLGYLFSAAETRMRRGGSPFTVMSCDNLPANGELTRSLLLEFADLKDRAVGDWIRENVSFPSSMVDRITPRVTDDTLDYVRTAFGVDDPCAVVSEAYLQWVLEDDFIAGRPELESVAVPIALDGRSVAVKVQLTRRGGVAPYEAIKMRLLNGSHSALAYVGYLVGHRAVDQAMRDPLVATFLRRYMDEDITPTIHAIPADVDLTDYKAILLQRFANPAVADQVQRLAQDGSAKIRNFLVPPLEDQLAAGGSIRWIAFALAAWYRYLRGEDEQGAPIAVEDPMRDELMARVRRGRSDPRHLLAMEAIFGVAIGANQQIASKVQDCLAAIDALGTREALRQRLAT